MTERWFIVAALLSGCGLNDPVLLPDASSQPEPEPRLEPITPLSAEQARAYLARVAPVMVGRVLSVAERDRIALDAGDVLREILETWAGEDGFVAAARALVETRLSVSGSRDGIDFDLPGNTVEHVVRHDLPWGEILTSETCFDASDNTIACDTGAPYAAGVLVTRAYMSSRASRFNLTRASTMLRAFACEGYPMTEQLQPRVQRETLLPMFRAETEEEQADARAAGGFGNGHACYACHGQFSAHAQPFVKFDQLGLWRAQATGLQNPDGQLGESFDGLLASHFEAPALAAAEASQIFGVEIDNLAGAARVIADSTQFIGCAVQNLLHYVFYLDRFAAIDAVLVGQIIDAVAAETSEPTLRHIVVETLSDRRVIDAALGLYETGGEP